MIRSKEVSERRLGAPFFPPSLQLLPTPKSSPGRLRTLSEPGRTGGTARERGEGLRLRGPPGWHLTLALPLGLALPQGDGGNPRDATKGEAAKREKTQKARLEEWFLRVWRMPANGRFTGDG